MEDQTSPSQSPSIRSSLLHRAQHFDPESWNQLVEIFTPFVYRWLRRWGAGPDDIPDLVQEVFLRVSTNVSKFQRESQGQSFRGWLWRISRNVFLDHVRHPSLKGFHSDMYGAIPDEIDDDELAESEASELLRKVIESVRGDFEQGTFEVFLRRAFEGQDYQQISQELSMKPSTTREAYRRVLSRIREECLELVGQGYWPFDVSES